MNPPGRVFLDANILVETAVSDFILRLAELGRTEVRWSSKVWEEALRAQVTKLNWDPFMAEHRRDVALSAFPFASVEGFEWLIPQCDNHPEDRHVLAAAIHGRCSAIITLNVQDFALASLARHGIEPIHPADFFLRSWEFCREDCIGILNSMAVSRRLDLPMMLSRLSAYCIRFTRTVSGELGISVPPYAPVRKPRG